MDGDGVTVFVTLVFCILVVGVIFLVSMHRAARMRAELRDEEDEGDGRRAGNGGAPYRGAAAGEVSGAGLEGCVACGSGRLESLARDAYRCMDCGYEGGSGLAEIHRQDRYAAIDAMSEAERRASGRKDLREACSLLIAAIPHLEAARTMTQDDRNQSAPEVASQEFMRGSQYLTEALQAAGNGWYKVCRERTLPFHVEIPDPHGGEGGGVVYGAGNVQVASPRALDRMVEETKDLHASLDSFLSRGGAADLSAGEDDPPA